MKESEEQRYRDTQTLKIIPAKNFQVVCITKFVKVISL